MTRAITARIDISKRSSSKQSTLYTFSGLTATVAGFSPNLGSTSLSRKLAFA